MKNKITGYFMWPLLYETGLSIKKPVKSAKNRSVGNLGRQ